ncbi:MAG: GAF domain-containing sensor histidine kinase [Anaerolineae bacterium]|nr:GAF domain-containing sensor histidine kinase [Anaerolineae bacterium]
MVTDYVIGLALGWLSLALGLLSYRWLRGWWQRRRYGPEIDHGLLLVEYGRRMTGTLDREGIVHLFTTDLPRVLGVERAVLLLPQEHQLVAGEQSVPISHAAVRWVASAGEAQRAERGHLHALIQQGRSDLGWARVWVPLLRGIDLRGLWLLGERKRGAHGRLLGFSPRDLRWLTALGRQAALVLEAIHYAEQERLAAADIRTLYRQVVLAREVERGRMARELHDGVLQDLCAVTRDLKALEAQTASSSGTDTCNAAGYADLTTRAGEAVQALRAICNDLRPPLLQQDLVAALKALVEGLDARSTAPVRIDVQIQNPQALSACLSDDVALALFRITQEALHNAIQHADASEIAVSLTQYPDFLRLTVIDDGRGIAGGLEPGRFVAEGHFGLAGMRERAAMIGARLDVQTAVDYGTAVVVQVPYATPPVKP